MRGIALVGPVVVLALVHLLQRLEVWATDSSPRPAGRRRAVSHLDGEAAAPSRRPSPVPRRPREGEASHHG